MASNAAATAHTLAGAALLAWAAQHPGGAVHPGLATRMFGAMHGLACAAPLSAGELIIRVPVAACGRRLSDAPLAASEAAQEQEGTAQDEKDMRGLRVLVAALGPIAASLSSDGGTAATAMSEVALRVLLSPEPLYRLYRARWLRCGEDVIPETFTDDELAALQSGKVADIVRARRAWAHNVLAALPWALADIAPVAFADFIAVLHAVRSHIHRVHLAKEKEEGGEEEEEEEEEPASTTAEGSEKRVPQNALVARANYLAADDVLALVPGIDLANHAFHGTPQCNTVRTFDGAQMCFEIHAARALPAGHELCFDYSAQAPMPTYQLFVTYGFVVRDNPNDEILVDFRDEFRECFQAAEGLEPEAAAGAESRRGSGEAAPWEKGGAAAAATAAALLTDQEVAKIRMRLLQRSGATSASQSTGFFVKGHVIARRSDCDLQGDGGKIMTWARMLTTTRTAFAKPATEALLLAGRPVSVTAELRALQFLVRKMAVMSRASPTTYSEDVALLKGMVGQAVAGEKGRAAAVKAVVTSSSSSSSSSSLHKSTAIQFRLAGKQLENDLLVAFGKRKRAVGKLLAKSWRKTATSF
jgi:hypothetical protein